eukprot:scaffold698_cov333-Pavlova_lutheri.AAC.5
MRAARLASRWANTRTTKVARRSAAMRAAPYEVVVKGAPPEIQKLGDCPFCHRVLLTMEEMEVPYETKLVDLGNKPDWLLEINPLGKVPVLRMGDKEYMPDSDEICAFLEKEYPEQALGTPEGAKEVGSKVFPAFAAFFKSKDPSDGTEQELLEQLRALNDYLQKSGPYVGGQTVCTVDMALAPKLHHMDLVLKEFKNWEVPEDMPAVKKYIALMRERPSFKATHYDNEIVYMGWKKKLES